MSVFIVDASVVAKWFIEEEHSEAALSILKEKIGSMHLTFCSLRWTA